jgi:hypothetical protein
MPTQADKNQSAYQTAYDELNRIQRRSDLEQGRVREHYILVIDCLRRFVEQQYGVRTPNRSAAEMRRLLHRVPIPPAQMQSLLDLMAENESIQAAAYLPGPGQGRQLVWRARTLIEQTEKSSSGKFEAT